MRKHTRCQIGGITQLPSLSHVTLHEPLQLGQKTPNRPGRSPLHEQPVHEPSAFTRPSCPLWLCPAGGGGAVPHQPCQDTPAALVVGQAQAMFGQAGVQRSLLQLVQPGQQAS